MPPARFPAGECPSGSEGGAETLLDGCAGRLGAVAAARLEEHCRQCAECRAFLETQRLVWEALGRWQAIPDARDFNRRFWQRVERTGGPRRRAALRRFAAGVSLRPALPLLLLAASWAVFLVAPPPAAPPAAPLAMAEVEQAEQALADLDMLRRLGIRSD